MKKPKPKQLGELGIMELFHLVGRKTIYRTIDHGPNNWTTQTKRWCLNMKTLKAEYVLCKEEVVIISENSKDTEK